MKTDERHLSACTVNTETPADVGHGMKVITTWSLTEVED